jgi:hypothetical protein
MWSALIVALTDASCDSGPAILFTFFFVFGTRKAQPDCTKGETFFFTFHFSLFWH